MGNKILWIPFIYPVLFAVLLPAAKIYQEFRKALFDLFETKGWPEEINQLGSMNIYDFKD